jgi:outer membrane lipoprotein-sorting protein
MKRTRLLIIVALMILPVLKPAFAREAEIKNGEDLLRAMHDRYATTWYHTMTFTQKSTSYKADGTSSSQTWYEAALLPGKLRIDIGTPSEGNGYIFSDGTLTIVKQNQVAATQPRVNMLLVLGFDVYAQDPAATIKIAKAEGYDLSKLHEDTWDGHAAYVVGAAKGDLKSKQFWVAKDTLLFLRDIEPTQVDPQKMEDIRFVHYQPLAKAWIAAGVEMYVDDKKVFSEDYSDIQADVNLTPAVFDPAQFSTTHWEK